VHLVNLTGSQLTKIGSENIWNRNGGKNVLNVDAYHICGFKCSKGNGPECLAVRIYAVFLNSMYPACKFQLNSVLLCHLRYCKRGHNLQAPGRSND
jgi:hypothetical protein